MGEYGITLLSIPELVFFIAVKAEGWLQAKHVHTLEAAVSVFFSSIRNDWQGEKVVTFCNELFVKTELFTDVLLSSLESDAIKDAMEYELAVTEVIVSLFSSCSRCASRACTLRMTNDIRTTVLLKSQSFKLAPLDGVIVLT